MNRRFRRVAVLVLALTSVAWSFPADGHIVKPHADVGFSFVPQHAQNQGIDPAVALKRLIEQLRPDVIRLPVYWSEAEVTRGTFDYSSVDSELAVIAEWNASHSTTRTIRVILVVGVRNLGYPEVFVPDWAFHEYGGVASDLAATPEYRAYVVETVERYERIPNLMAWQVENEPLDDVPAVNVGVAPVVDVSLVLSTRDLVHELDSKHSVVLTTYDSATLDLDMRAIEDPTNQTQPAPAGHPSAILAHGDIVGLDAYVITSDADAASVPAEKRIDWKAVEMQYWSQRAHAVGKPFWITEMQAEPFSDTTFGFQPSYVIAEAHEFRDSSPSLVLLWGMGTWLKSPAWMSAAQQAMQILRS